MIRMPSARSWVPERAEHHRAERIRGHLDAGAAEGAVLHGSSLPASTRVSERRLKWDTVPVTQPYGTLSHLSSELGGLDAAC